MLIYNLYKFDCGLQWFDVLYEQHCMLTVELEKGSFFKETQNIYIKGFFNFLSGIYDDKIKKRLLRGEENDCALRDAAVKVAKGTKSQSVLILKATDAKAVSTVEIEHVGVTAVKDQEAREEEVRGAVIVI